MRLTIEIDECQNYGLSPVHVYNRLCEEYWGKLKITYKRELWGMSSTSDRAARELYAHIKERTSNKKSLILTYTDAENCFELYKLYADIWAKNLQQYTSMFR